MAKQSHEIQEPHAERKQKDFGKIAFEEMKKAIPDVERHLRAREALVARSRFEVPKIVDVDAGSDDD